MRFLFLIITFFIIKMQFDASNNELSYFNNYINSLIENINSNKFNETYNLLLDGGAFNGGYMFGSLIFIKQLENKNLIKIKKISGTSIGSILGLAYLTNNLNKLIILFNNVLLNYKTNHNFSNLKNEIKKFVNEIYIDFNKINNNLFITYYDVDLINQVVISEFKNKDELIDILIRSSHIPFLIDGNAFYKDRYLDGLTPYLLKDNNKTLSINIASPKICKDILFTKNEKNVWSRLMCGVNECNNFFSNKSCFLITEINNWTIFDYFYFRWRDIIFIIIIFILKNYQYILKYIPNSIKNNLYILRIKTLLITIIKELFHLFII